MCGQCEVKCMHHWMEDKLLCVFTPQVTGVCPPPRQLEWITYPIFSAPAAHRPLLGPWQWSHVGGERREGKEERRGERTSGAASHKKNLKKSPPDRFSIKHQAAVCSSRATSKRTREAGYIPIAAPRKQTYKKILDGFLIFSGKKALQSLLETFFFKLIIHTGSRGRSGPLPLRSRVCAKWGSTCAPDWHRTQPCLPPSALRLSRGWPGKTVKSPLPPPPPGVNSVSRATIKVTTHEMERDQASCRPWESGPPG